MCMIDDADGYFRIHDDKERTARKAHKCYECQREIAPGERYEEMHGLLDDCCGSGWVRYRTCSHCVAARNWLMEQCGGWLYGGVYEDLAEHWNYEPEAATLSLGRLIVGMRRRWLWKGNLMSVPA